MFCWPDSLEKGRIEAHARFDVITGLLGCFGP